MRGPRRAPAPHDGDRRPCGGAPARRRARSGGRRRSPNPPGAPSRDVRSRDGTIPMLRGRPARACCGPCSVSFLGCWGRGGRCGFKGISPGSGLWDGRGPVVPVGGGGMVVAPSSPWGDGGAVGWCVSRWCPALPLPGGGSTIGAGGLSFRVRYGSGRFPAPLWPPGWGWGCGGPGWPAPPRVWGGGWVGPGLRSGRGGSAPAPVRGPAPVMGGVRVGVCGVVVRVGLLVPVG